MIHIIKIRGRLIMAEAVGFLFCGKATPVATVHRTVARSRLSNPTFSYHNIEKGTCTRQIPFSMAEAVGFEPTGPVRGLPDFESGPL